MIVLCAAFAGFLAAPRMQQLDRGRDSKHSHVESLRTDLADAVSEERFDVAASLRDELAQLTKDAEISVIDANTAFYKALSTHDEDAMKRIWAADSPLASCCSRVYDGFPVLHGRTPILELWRQVSSDARVHVADTDTKCVLLRGGYSAVVHCIERRLGMGNDGLLAATNIYELDEVSAQWRLVLHQARPIAIEAGSEDDAVDYDADDFPGATG